MGEGARQVAQVVKAGGKPPIRRSGRCPSLEMVASTLTEMDKFEQSAKEMGKSWN